MILSDLRDVFEAQIGLELHIVADFDGWTLIEDVVHL